MKPIQELLKKHNSTVFQVSPSTTVFEALRLLAEYGVGAMTVMDQGKLVGVVSERDYTRKVALQGKSSKETTVAEIMTRTVVTVTPGTGTLDCMSLMSQKKIRHLPVVGNAGQVVGIVTIGDVVKSRLDETRMEADSLRDYVMTSR